MKNWVGCISTLLEGDRDESSVYSETSENNKPLL